MLEKEVSNQDSEIRPMTKESTVSTFHETRRSRRSYYSTKKNRSFYSDPIYSSQSPVRNQKQRINNPSPSPQRKCLYWQNWLLPDGIRTTKKLQLPTFHSKSICAMFTDENKLFIDHNSEEILQIASLTKIMTAFTVVNICNNYGFKIRDTWVKIQKQASMMEGTSANLRNGEQLLVIDLLYGLMLPSGNDAGVALSQFFGKYLSFYYSSQQNYKQHESQISDRLQKFEALKDYYDEQYRNDSIKLFVFEMNKNCQKIGLKKTKFSNPTGLSDDKNCSTAHDIAQLISFCMKNHLLRSIFKKKIYICEAKNQKLGYVRQIQWKNTNQHLFTIKECIGVKTGITPGAGPCLSTAYRIMGRQLIMVVLNSRSLQDRYIDSQNTFRYARSCMQTH